MPKSVLSYLMESVCVWWQICYFYEHISIIFVFYIDKYIISIKKIITNIHNVGKTHASQKWFVPIRLNGIPGRSPHVRYSERAPSAWLPSITRRRRCRSAQLKSCIYRVLRHRRQRATTTIRKQQKTVLTGESKQSGRPKKTLDIRQISPRVNLCE